MFSTKFCSKLSRNIVFSNNVKLFFSNIIDVIKIPIKFYSTPGNYLPIFWIIKHLFLTSIWHLFFNLCLKLLFLYFISFHKWLWLALISKLYYNSVLRTPIQTLSFTPPIYEINIGFFIVKIVFKANFGFPRNHRLCFEDSKVEMIFFKNNIGLKKFRIMWKNTIFDHIWKMSKP